VKRWRIGRAGDDQAGRDWLEASAERFRAWHRTGELPVPPTATRLRRPGAAAWLAESALFLAAVAAPVGFLWLVARRAGPVGVGESRHGVRRAPRPW
jgi:hypothetical protein